MNKKMHIGEFFDYLGLCGLFFGTITFIFYAVEPQNFFLAVMSIFLMVIGAVAYNFYALDKILRLLKDIRG